MIVPIQFDLGELIFEITKPFIPDEKTGDLVESEKWMVLIHKGTVTWFSGGPLLDLSTQHTALFASTAEALKASVAFAVHCGLRQT